MLTFQQLGRLGRFGNQLWQIASTIGVATKHGYDYAFPYWQNYDHRTPPPSAKFQGSNEDIDVQKYFKNPLPLLPENMLFREQKVPWGYHDLHLPNENISLWGNMQSEKYFAHCKDLIRHYFEIDVSKLPVFVNVDFPFKTMFDGGQAICGIHIRFGDYVPQQDYHPVMPLKYYEKAMAEFPADTIWVVFSDEPERAKEIIGNNAVYFKNNFYLNDFWAMSKCDHFIISNSTLPWWAAWLNKNPNKKIISPSGANWFGPAAGINGNDIIPESWTQIRF